MAKILLLGKARLFVLLTFRRRASTSTEKQNDCRYFQAAPINS